MKIELTDKQIKEMAKAIYVLDTLNKLAAAPPGHVLCYSTTDTRKETSSLRSYSASNMPYADMIKPIVDVYREACIEASRKALTDIRTKFRAIADGETSS